RPGPRGPVDAGSEATEGESGPVRHVSAWLLLAALLAPGALRADNTVGSGECRHLTSQIHFYEARLERAEQLGNALWEARLESHLDSLKERREERCPDPEDGETMRMLA